MDEIKLGYRGCTPIGRVCICSNGMEANVKYVMFDVDGIDVPVIFPEVIQHHQVVALVGGPWHSPATPVSAGKITLCQSIRRGQLGPLRVEAHGESISLELKSRPEDSDILTRYFEDF